MSAATGSEMKVAVYSALYGGYDCPRPVDFGSTPAYLYTDDPGLVAPGWEVRVCPIPGFIPMLQAKWWKLHPHLAAPGADASVWIDASLRPTVPDYVSRCVEALGGDDWSMMPHPWRDCIYQEAMASAQMRRYIGVEIEQQAGYYRSLGHPEHWGLFATGTNCRRHTPRVLQLGVDWWWENVTRTYQDQVSLPVLLRLAGAGIRWNTQIPWSEWWEHTPHGL